MNNWKTTSILTAVAILIVLVAAYSALDMRVSVPSANIEFSPGEATDKKPPAYVGERPKNIIVFIADGMGFSHLTLALHTRQSEDALPVWYSFDVKGWHDARSVYGPLTDSEASATAMATGTSTMFGHIGVDADGEHLTSLFELASANQYTTGIVTDSYIWDGTPAAFFAHTADEDDARDILTQLAASELDLIFGELEDLGEDGVPEEDETLEILSRRFQMLDESLALPDGANASAPVAAIYDEDEVQDVNSSPNLMQLTQTALEYLSSQDKPFVLLVESEEIDSASHSNDSERVIAGLDSIQQTLTTVLNYSRAEGRTLVLFTADHETGGLAAVADYDDYPDLQIRWSTKEHSAALVPLFADGPGAEHFADVHRNREIGQRLEALVTRAEEATEGE